MLKNNICLKFKKISRLVRDNIDNSKVYHENPGLTNMAGWIIGFIYSNSNKTIYQKDIEKEFKINKSTASELLQSMEDNGYVLRIVSDEDRRLKRITLTEKGLLIQQEVMLTGDRISLKAVHGFSLEEQEMLKDFLKRVELNLEGDIK